MINPHPIDLNRLLIQPASNLLSTIVIALVMDVSLPAYLTSNPISMHPITFQNQILISAQDSFSFRTPAFPVYSGTSKITTPMSPNAKMIAPGIPPTARYPAAPSPIKIPDSRAPLLLCPIILQHFKKFNSEDQGTVSRNHPRNTNFTICQICRDIELILSTRFGQL